MKFRIKKKKIQIDLALQFPKKLDFMANDLHRDHPQAWELSIFTRSFWRAHDELGAF